MRVEATLEDRPLLDQYLLEHPAVLQTANWVIEYASQKFQQINTLLEADHTTPISLEAKNKIRMMMLQKAFHIREVVVAMWDISQDEASQKSLPSLLELAFAHDVARFTQALLGTLDDAKTFDHGNTGRDLFIKYVNEKALWNKYLVNFIAEGIERHNKKTVPQNAHFMIKHIRDADKLALFRRAELYVKSSYDEVDAKERLFTEDCYQAFMSEMVMTPKMPKTEADLILFRLGWIFELHSQEARNRLVEEGHLEFMLGALKKLAQGRNPLFMQVDKKIYQWMREHDLSPQLPR